MKKKHRLRRFIAKIKRTFVADCPRCHKHFYGNKAYAQHVTYRDESGSLMNYRYVCHKCAKEQGLKLIT